MTDYGLKGKLKEAFDFLSLINQIAYRDTYLLSNEVLSKNPFTNNFLDRYLKGENPQRISRVYIVSILLKYYFRSFAHLIIYILNFLAFYISKLRFSVSNKHNELTVIDTFFLIDRIEKENVYNDPYFVGLKDILDKLEKQYVYLPVFCYTKNPLRLLKTFKILTKQNTPVLTEYQLLSVTDMLIISVFVLIYPVKVFGFIRTLISEINKMHKYYNEINLLRSAIIDDLPHATFHRFSRYLQGKRITTLPCQKIKLISWFENQTIDKNLYKGLRERGSNVKIYGAQPFLFSQIALNILVDENEVKFGIVPDKIIVNGSYYIPDSTNLNFEVGPSFRYKKIFSTVIKEKERTNILVLLPYSKLDAKNALELLSKLEPQDAELIIKTHPAVPIEALDTLAPPNSKIVENDIYELFKTTKIVIGAASGSLIEAASLGIPVISLKNNARFDYNPLPEYGRGIIWEEVANLSELKHALLIFDGILQDETKKNRVKQVAEEYKKMFFCRHDELNIINSFELYN